MPAFKTYAQVDRSNPSNQFSIGTMQASYAKRQGKPDEPHRHDFFTVIVAKQAKGTHIVDFNAYDFGTNQIFFVAPGQVHQVIETDKPEGYVITFSHQFLARNNIPVSFIEDLHLFNSFEQAPPLNLDVDKFESVSHFCQEMLNMAESSRKFKHEAIGAYLKLLLITCNNACQYTPEQLNSGETGHRLLRSFKTELENHFNEWHSTSTYAEALNVSPDHLNRTIKQLTGKTAKEHIQSRLTIAAKRMLYFSDLSNKEIAYSLGFSDPSNFSNFFKKCTGTAPSHFPKQT